MPMDCIKSSSYYNMEDVHRLSINILVNLMHSQT